jgi:hypothetical protein
MHRGRLQPEVVRALHLKAVYPDVQLAVVIGGVGVPGDDRGLVDVRAAVTGVQPEQRQQFEEVDVPADSDLLPGGG